MDTQESIAELKEIPVPGTSLVRDDFALTLSSNEPIDVSFYGGSQNITIQFDSYSLETAHDSDVYGTFHCLPNMVSVHPAGQQIQARSIDSGKEFLVIDLKTSWIERNLTNTKGMDEYRYDVIPEAGTLARLIRSEFLRGSQDRLYLESLMMALVHLSGTYFAEDNQTASKESLSTAQVQLVDELIDSLLDTDINLERLASEVEFSPYHFLRAFKHSFGITPHQLVIERRLARAREALRHSDLPIADIALNVGFSSQAHLSDMFKKRLGVTPGNYRKSAKT